jgi:hypothetical protein
MALQAELNNLLYNLRLSQANRTTTILTTFAITLSAATIIENIAYATHITFNNNNVY